MIFTSRMVYLTAVTVKERRDEIAKELLALGLMHFVDVTTVDPEGTHGDVLSRPAHEHGGSGEARRRLESILASGDIQRPTVTGEEVKAQSTLSPDAAVELADSVGSRIDAVRDKQRSIQQQINRLEDVQRHLPSARGSALRDAAQIGSGGAFLDIHTGSVPTIRLESLQQKLSLFPAVLTALAERGERTVVVLAAMKRNATEIGELLERHDFRAEELDGESASETSGTVEAKLSELRTSQRQLADSVPALVREKREEIESAWRGMRVRELLGRMNNQFAETRRVVVVSGWIPSQDRERVETALTDVTGGHIYFEWHEDTEFRSAERDNHGASAPRVTIPSRLQNPRFLGPFQNLVTNFGVPAYGTVDPTWLVAVAYLIMFGLMFGDVGHGAILLIAGLAGRAWLRRQSVPPTGGIGGAIPMLSRLMIWCGGAAIVAGALFGSYFGFEVISPLWFDYHGVVAGHVEAGPVESIFDILTITIYFGVVVIALGLVINWINLIRQRRWFPLIFDKAGVLGGTIYGAGIVLAAQFASSGFRSVPANAVLLGCIVVPAVLLFLKAPLEGHRKNPLWWIMEWAIEMLEVFSGYLANTLSFMRVAGLGIAHVTLMIAFYQIAKMASPVGMNVVGVVILIFGNALVIVLEGLSAGIQSLRLNYYEFFSKHFQPSGVAYKPVSLEVS